MPLSVPDNWFEMSGSESENAMSDLDGVVRCLAEIIDELAALPEGPSSERFRLLAERDAVRREGPSLRRRPTRIDPPRLLRPNSPHSRGTVQRWSNREVDTSLAMAPTVQAASVQRYRRSAAEHKRPPVSIDSRFE